jgi:hypothetical protein
MSLGATRWTAAFCGTAPASRAGAQCASPQALGIFTSVLAAGSICGGITLQRNSAWLTARPGLLLGSCTLLTALAQLGMAVASGNTVIQLAMTLLIGAGTACLLSGVNLISQVGAPMAIRGRMAGLGQIAFLGGGGLSGLLAATLSLTLGLRGTFALLGTAGLVLGLIELRQRGRLRLELRSA